MPALLEALAAIFTAALKSFNDNGKLEDALMTAEEEASKARARLKFKKA